MAKHPKQDETPAEAEEFEKLITEALSNAFSKISDNTKKPLEIEDVKKLLIGELESEPNVPQVFDFSHLKGIDIEYKDTEYDEEPSKEVKKRYTEKQEVISALSQEKACFANDNTGSTHVIKCFSDEVFKFLLKQLGNGTIATTHLSFSANVLNEQQAIQLIELLETNKTLQSLELIIDNSPATTQAIAELLKKNKHLKEIYIKCDNEGAIEIAGGLEVNDSLQKLVLSHSEINNEGAIEIAKALGVNASLQELDLRYNENITEAVLPYFRRALEVNENLQIFKVCNYNIELDGNVVDYLRKTEEKQDDSGDNHKLEGNPSDNQPADDSPFSLSTLEEALPTDTVNTPDENAPLGPMGESSGQTEGEAIL